MTQKPTKSAGTRKPKPEPRKERRVANAEVVEGHGSGSPEPSRRGRGREDPSHWCRNRFWWSSVCAHPSTPEHFADLAKHFLAWADEADRETARRALERIHREGADPSTRRGDLRGHSFVSFVASLPGYAHTRTMFDSSIWHILGPDGIGPDELASLQDALSWELVLGVRYGPSGRAQDDRDVISIRTGRQHWRSALLILSRLGSLQWRSLGERQFVAVVRLLAGRPSWPGLALLCVLMLRMGDSDARCEMSEVRQAIVASMDALSCRPNVDPRAAAVFQHLVRRRILSASRTLEHTGAVLDWARSELIELEQACRSDSDRRWHARQVDALACSLANRLGPGVDFLGWSATRDLGLGPSVPSVRHAIHRDARAQRLCSPGRSSE